MTSPSSESGPANFRLITLGETLFLREIDGEAEEMLRGGKVIALLIYLACQEGRAVAREELADLLWGDESPDNARASLRQALYSLRRLVGDVVLGGDRQRVILSDDRIAFDRAAFIAGARAGDLARMLAVYEGPFCGQLAVGEAHRFQEWMEEERARLRHLLREVAYRALPTHLGKVPAAETVSLARRLHALEPDDDLILGGLIDALIAAGAIDEARERLVSAIALRRSAGEPIPDPLQERARRLERWDPAAPPRRGTLDALGYQLVGRESAVQQLLVEAERARLGEPRRVLLTGPAGIGKTRLLDEVEARLRLRGARVVRIRLLPPMREVPYAALADLVRDLVRLPGSLGIPELAARELVTLVPELTARFPNAAPADAGDEDRRRRLRMALGELLAAVAEERLVVIMVDDVAGVDDASRRILASVDRGSRSPLLELFVARPGPSMEGVEPQRVITLLPLEREELRTVLEGVAPLPDAAWVDPFLDALMERSHGVPQTALRIIRSVADAGILRLGDASWECEDPDRLRLEVTSRAWLDDGFTSLSPLALRLLLLLARWELPLDERDLVELALTMDDRRIDAEVGAALRRLESLGFAVSRDTSWSIVDASVSEVLLARCSPGEARLILERLTRYWGAATRLDVERLEHLALLIGVAEDLPLLRVLARMAARAPRIRAIELRGRRLARRIARAAGRPAWERECLRAMGMLARLNDRELAVFGAGMAVATGLLVWLLLMLQPRLSFEVEPMAEGPTYDVVDLSVQPRVVVRNGFGRIYRSPVPLRLRSDQSEVLGDQSRTTTGGRAQFERIAFRVSDQWTREEELRIQVEGPWFVRSAEAQVRGSRGKGEDGRFRIVAASVNGRPIGDSLSAIVPPGDSIRIVLTFAYSTMIATANYVVGALPTWGRREREVIRLAGLPSPVFDAWRTVAFTVPPPPGPADEYIVILCAAEDGVDYLFSLTNWTIGRPLWYDGNDVSDLGVEAFERLRREGRLTVRTEHARHGIRLATPWFPMRAPPPPEAIYEAETSLIGTAIRVRVDPTAPRSGSR